MNLNHICICLLQSFLGWQVIGTMQQQRSLIVTLLVVFVVVVKLSYDIVMYA